MRAFADVTIIDGKGDVIVDGVLITEGERIGAVGDRVSTPVPDNAEVIWGDGLYLLPGLIDSHAHLAYVYEISEDTVIAPNLTEMELTLHAVHSAATLLADGVTTIRDVGEATFIDVACRRAIEAGKIPGPRILTCGPAFRPGHGTGRYATVADGVDGVRAAVRRNIKAGTDWIKLFVSGEWTYRPHTCFYSFEEIEAAVMEAHRSGLKVAVHAYGGLSAQYSIRAGVDTIEHGRFLEPDDIAMMLDRGTVLVNNLLWTLSPFNLRHFPESEEIAHRSVQRPYQAGVPMAIGADAYPIDHALAREAELFVRMGMSEKDVFGSLTSLSAQICGVPDRGVIEPGKLADLILVEGNPLQDIRALQRVRAVVKGGEVVRTEIPIERTSLVHA